MVTAKGETRPQVQADVKIFSSGNTRKNAQDLQAFIREQELKRNQILSITSNETDIEDGDNVLALYYRKQSIYRNEQPLDTIQFDVFNNIQSWEQQIETANTLIGSGNIDLISLSCTPKNIGNARCQTAWYTNSKVSSDQTAMRIERRDGDWEALAVDAKDWLNTHIPPHQLISVSFHEGAHPNNGRDVYAVISHRAGANPVPLSKSSAGKSLPLGGVYDMRIVRHDDPEVAMREALGVINARGGQEGHVCTTTNDSIRQDIFCTVISWSALLEANIEEDMRPTGCQCTIF